jgi:soluble lytic murein transglycosylase-like protein
MKTSIMIALSVCILLLADFAAAGIYRYEDENGVIHFSNCPRDPQFKLYIRESNEDVGAEPAESPPSMNMVNIVDSKNFDFLISELARKYEIDFALVKAMIRAESGFNPYAVSRKGARGLMQLMPETALRMNVSNCFNPKENIEGGVRYLKYLLSLFNNDLRLSLAAYNAGENIVSQLGTIPPYRETVDYVRKVLSFYQSYRK